MGEGEGMEEMKEAEEMEEGEGVEEKPQQQEHLPAPEGSSL